MAGRIKNSRRFSRRSTASRVTDDSHPSHSLVSLFAPVILAALSRSSMPLHRTHTATSQIASVPLFAVVWSFVHPPPSPSSLLIYVHFSSAWCCFSSLFFLFPRFGTPCGPPAANLLAGARPPIKKRLAQSDMKQSFTDQKP